MITSDLIQRRIEMFWGYGSLDAPVWVVGMEEGFRITSDVVADRRMLERQFLLPTVNGMFDASRPILRDGKAPNEDEILDFQRFVLGDGKRNEVATIELMPLPSPDISSWPYGDISRFETRESYLRTCKKQRVQGLRDLVQKYSPKLVIFYSVGYLRDWVAVVGKMPDEITHQMYFTRTEKTSFCIIPQPQYLPRAYERLYEFAEKIRGEITI